MAVDYKRIIFTFTFQVVAELNMDAAATSRRAARSLAVGGANSVTGSFAIKWRATQVFSALSLEQNCSYDEIKTAILNSYKLSEATYLQNFRNLRRSGAMSYEEHLTRLRDSYS